MISGPTSPEAPDGLLDLIPQHIGLVEHGMQVVSEDLQLGQGGQVEFLARDAGGAPVLVFVVTGASDPGLGSRILAARSWMRQNGLVLCEVLAEAAWALDRPARLLVLGTEFLATTVNELQDLGLEDLSVYQFSSFAVLGRQHLNASPLILSGLLASAPACGLEPFGVPAGLLDPGARALCAHFLDLVHLLDPELSATGDRFSRRFFLRGRFLAELLVEGKALHVLFPSGLETPPERHQIQSRQDCHEIVDRLARHVLRSDGTDGTDGTDRTSAEAGVVEEAMEEAMEEANGEAIPTAPATAPATAAATADHREQELTPVHPEPRPGLDEDRFSLEPIRQSVAKAQLSREEFSALGNPGPEA